jgi:hypothetical protein
MADGTRSVSLTSVRDAMDESDPFIGMAFLSRNASCCDDAPSLGKAPRQSNYAVMLDHDASIERTP